MSRFDDWPRAACIGLLVALVALIGLGMVEAPSPVVNAETLHVDADRTDHALYWAIVVRMENGDDYYHAASLEQSNRGYPLRPIMTVREPTLSYAALAVGGLSHLRFVLVGLGLAAGVAMLITTEGLATGRPSWVMSLMAFSAALMMIFGKETLVMHEVWAMLFMILALVASANGRPRSAAVLGLLAALFRELAFPFLLVMAVLAWRERNTRELRAWLVSIALFIAAYAAHAALVLGQTSGNGVTSPGWLVFGGWAFVLESVRATSVLMVAPIAVSAVVVPLALIGWLSRVGRLADRVVLLLGCYVMTFIVIGRPENSYWGLLYTAILLPGLGFAPRALMSLAQRLGPASDSESLESREPVPAGE